MCTCSMYISNYLEYWQVVFNLEVRMQLSIAITVVHMMANMCILYMYMCTIWNMESRACTVQYIMNTNSYIYFRYGYMQTLYTGWILCKYSP